MRSSRSIFLVIAVLALAGCARGHTPPLFTRGATPATRVAQPVPQGAPVVAEPAPIIAAPPVVAAGDEPYTLDAGDRLRIVVFGQDGLTSSYAVDAGGRITMPLIGAVPARGMTTAELQQAIAARLRGGFVREPHVAVEVELYRPFFILGEVTFPGQYPYVPNMTIETAVAIAGGYTPRAFKTRVELSRPVEGGVMARSKVTTNYLMKPGDTVVISERWF